MPTRKLYAREFKSETVQLITARGPRRMPVARELGIDPEMLRR